MVSGKILYSDEPDAQEPWNAIGGSVTVKPEGGFDITPPSPMILTMSERAAVVCNKWKLRLIFKEEIMLAAAVGGAAFACVMASEEIRKNRKNAGAKPSNGIGSKA